MSNGLSQSLDEPQEAVEGPGVSTDTGTAAPGATSPDASTGAGATGTGAPAAAATAATDATAATATAAGGAVRTASADERSEVVGYLETAGKDPSRLIYEDELTGIRNRRFLLRYLENDVPWNADDFTLSLLVVDLDHFKEINDNYGHEVGDAMLTWVATLLSEAAGETGFPVRYGGDEFVLLLPGADRASALQTANGLMQRTRDRQFRVRGTEDTFQIALSIGIATAPEDARNGKDLFHAGDTALYHAKRSGRGQLASAAEIDMSKVFSRTALHRLKAIGISGRQTELSKVSESLEELSHGRSRFITVEGAPGLGKTAFLDTIASNLASNEVFRLVRVSGVQQEAYRPYYLATSLLVQLLKAHGSSADAALETLSTTELGSLSQLLPQLAADDAEQPAADDGAARAAIFAALMESIPKLAGKLPLVLLIDDLQFADEATLYVLGALVKSDAVDVLVCATHMESVALDEDGDPPFKDFLAQHQRELAADALKLKPLDRAAILDHMRGVFPNLQMPENFDSDLEAVTLGNPLFITEIIRKLVRDQKATLVGQEWLIDSLPDDYLPQSLEEVVGEMIAALDQESRALLEQASTMGEDVSVSILSGAAEVEESKVLQFLDRAEGLGLIELDFQINDEIMRFLGKRVMEISYGSIEEDRRKKLHERVANYQEGLLQDRLMPSASLLAYHFKRSANQEKARRYQSMRVAYKQSVFDARDVSAYIAELGEGGLDPGRPLDDESLEIVPDVLRGLLTAVRSIQLYPKDSDAVAGSELKVKRSLERILDETDRLTVGCTEEGALQINGEELDFGELSGVAGSFVALLRRARLQGIAFVERVDGDELLGLLGTIAGLDPASIDGDFWRRYASQRDFHTIEVKQTRYSRSAAEDADDAGASVAVADAVEEELDREDLAAIPEVLRAFTKTAKSVKLYPVDSDSAATCLQELRESLVPVLQRRQVLSLARTEQSLLANGGVVNTSDFELLAQSFLQLMESLGLESVAFSGRMEPQELERLFQAVRAIPAGGPEPEFWKSFVARHGIQGIGVNHQHYALVTAPSFHLTGPEAEAQTAEALPGGEPLSDESFESLAKELLVKGEDALLGELLDNVFAGYREHDALTREQVLSALDGLLESLILGLQHKFASVAGMNVIGALATEEHPDVLERGVNLMHAMATASLQQSDSVTAAQLYEAVADRRAELRQDAEHGGSTELVDILGREPDDTARKMLQSDLSSGDVGRQGDAARVLAALGESGIPVLIDLIKQERDLRVRQAAASILADMGPAGEAQMKRALMLEVIVEQRFRILEVIETVTMDLQEELALCLGDTNPKIRRAAFRLAERLHYADLVEVLELLARDDDAAVAKGAIRSLTGLATDEAIQILTGVLQTTKDTEVAIACCQALGQIGDPAVVDALSKVLGKKNMFFFGYQWGDQVRATAALVLSNMSGSAPASVLRRFVDDRDPRIRRVARSVVGDA